VALVTNPAIYVIVLIETIGAHSWVACGSWDSEATRASGPRVEVTGGLFG